MRNLLIIFLFVSSSIVYAKGDFVNQDMVYLYQKQNITKRLTIKTKEHKKNKDIVIVALKGHATFFGKPSLDQIQEHKAYLVPSDDTLYQLKKIKKESGDLVLKWFANPKKNFINFVYKDKKGKTEEKNWERSVKKPQFDFAGLWYLIPWLNQNKIDSTKISYYHETNPKYYFVQNEGLNKKTLLTTYSIKENNTTLIYTIKVDKNSRIINFIDEQLSNVFSLEKDKK